MEVGDDPVCSRHVTPHLATRVGVRPFPCLRAAGLPPPTDNGHPGTTLGVPQSHRRAGVEGRFLVGETVGRTRCH